MLVVRSFGRPIVSTPPGEVIDEIVSMVRCDPDRARPAGRPGAAGDQDRRHLPADRRRRFDRRRDEERARVRGRPRQQRLEGDARPAVRGGRRPARAEGREDQAGFRGPPGQPAGRRDRGRTAHQRREGRRAGRRLQQQRHRDREPGRGTERRPVPQRRVVVGVADDARLQVVLPHHAARRPVRAQLLRVPEGPGGEEEDRAEELRADEREHAVGQRDDEARGEARCRTRPQDHVVGHLSGEEHAVDVRGADAEVGVAAGRHAVVVSRRCDPVDEDVQGARLHARHDPRERRGVLGHGVRQDARQGRGLRHLARRSCSALFIS